MDQPLSHDGVGQREHDREHAGPGAANDDRFDESAPIARADRVADECLERVRETVERERGQHLKVQQDCVRREHRIALARALLREVGKCRNQAQRSQRDVAVQPEQFAQIPEPPRQLPVQRAATTEFPPHEHTAEQRRTIRRGQRRTGGTFDTEFETNDEHDVESRMEQTGHGSKRHRGACVLHPDQPADEDHRRQHAGCTPDLDGVVPRRVRRGLVTATQQRQSERADLITPHEHCERERERHAQGVTQGRP